MKKQPKMFESPNQMDGNRKYLYGVIQAQEKKSFGSIGIGNRGDEVYTVIHNGIAAVVSGVPPLDYGSMTKDVLVHHLLCHQKATEQIMQEHLILPCKFGTMVDDEEDIIGILNQGYSLFAKTLHRMNEKIELNMVTTWNKDLIFKDIVNEEKKVQELQESIDSASGGKTVEKKIELGKLVQSILVAKREKLRGEIVAALDNCTEALCDHDIMDDLMIMNTSFLLNRERQGEFERTVDELDKKYRGRLNFRCIGPLPPYSFGMIQIGKMESEKIDQAREVLNLGRKAILSEDKIKRAYRELVVRLHPDKREGTSSQKGEFQKITEAYKMLLDYCRCGGPSSQKPFSIKIGISKDI